MSDDATPAPLAVGCRALFALGRWLSQLWRRKPVAMENHGPGIREIEYLTIQATGEGSYHVPADCVALLIEPRFVGEETHIHAMRYKPIAPQPSLVQEGVVHPFLVWAKSGWVAFWEKFKNALVIVRPKPRDCNGCSVHIHGGEDSVAGPNVSDQATASARRC
jgi:hypothetical protein